MYKHTKAFVAFCKNELTFELSIPGVYQSLSACILDCVFSLRAKYASVTVPVVNRYAQKYLGGDRFSSGGTASTLIKHINEEGGPKSFAKNFLDNEQKSGGVLKAEICLQLATYLGYLHIDTIDDFRYFESPELLEIVVRAVKGIGDAGTHYLFMLTGDPDRCKPDVHIHHCIRDACGENISNDDCQVLFTETVAILKSDYPDLTVAKLDGIIWNKYQSSR